MSRITVIVHLETNGTNPRLFGQRFKELVAELNGHDVSVTTKDRWYFDAQSKPPLPMRPRNMAYEGEHVAPSRRRMGHGPEA